MDFESVMAGDGGAKEPKRTFHRFRHRDATVMVALHETGVMPWECGGVASLLGGGGEMSSVHLYVRHACLDCVPTSEFVNHQHLFRAEFDKDYRKLVDSLVEAASLDSERAFYYAECVSALVMYRVAILDLAEGFLSRVMWEPTVEMAKKVHVDTGGGQGDGGEGNLQAEGDE